MDLNTWINIDRKTNKTNIICEEKQQLGTCFENYNRIEKIMVIYYKNGIIMKRMRKIQLKMKLGKSFNKNNVFIF